jgi:hypothetical protein
MDQQTIARLREELELIEKWEKLPGEADPIGYEARKRRRPEIIRELDSAGLRPHRIGILMCAAGRFLECSTCHLSFEFPAGAHFGTIEKQFESHSCGSPTAARPAPPPEKT